MKRLAVSALLFAAVLLGALPSAAQLPPTTVAPTQRLTKAPRLTRFVEANYPEAERTAGHTATVVLQLAISATGTVEHAVVRESAGPAFDAAAVEAAQKFVFEPAEIDGKPAAIKILYRYEFTLEKEIPTQGTFDGVVRSRGTKAPVAGVTVELAGGQHTETDEKGHFHFDDVPPGKLAVSISGAGLTPVRTEETFAAGKVVTATYSVEPAPKVGAGEPSDDLEIVVHAPPLEKQVVTTEVSAEQARKMPGTQGDVLKVVENMPGVGRPPAGTGQLVVWGSSPQDTRIYVDGVRIPLLYHFGGYRSVISSDFVKSVDLSPGGYGAEYGRGLGGLVRVDLKPLEDDGFHGAVSANLLDASASTKVSITDKLRVAVAFRKSYLDALVPLVTSQDVGILYPIPRYADGQLRILYALSRGESIELGGLFSTDALDRVVASSDPEAQESESDSTRWYRILLKYRRELEGGGLVTITPSVGADSIGILEKFGGTPTQQNTDSNVFGLRATYRAPLNPSVTITGGLDLEGASSDIQRSGSITSPPREGDIRVFGQAPSDQIGSDNWHTVIGSIAAFAEADIALLDGRVHVVPGMRFEPYVISASRRTPVEGDTPSVGALSEDTNVEPRLAARLTVAPRLTLKAAWGLYHEAPAPEDLSAVFGNPLLTTSRANQFLAGAESQLTASLRVECTGFYTISQNLDARSPLPAPLLAQALEPIGSGRAYGVQFLVRHEMTKRFFGWLSYAIVRSERQDQPGGRWRLFDFDQTHVVTAIGSYDLGAGFEVGVRIRASTGFPRTPVVGAYYDARLDAYEPIFGVQNTERLPPFFQADARVAKKFTFGHVTLETYIDVQNVTNQKNPEEVVYNNDYSQKAYITGLPILPVIGARLSW